MRLFDLVEEDDGIGLAADLFGQLAARIFKADVSRGRADDLAHRMLFHELAHVHAHHQPLVAEHGGGKRLGKLRLAHARGADEDERADGAVGVFQPRAGAADGLGDGGDRLVLPDDALVQLLFQMQ